MPKVGHKLGVLTGAFIDVHPGSCIIHKNLDSSVLLHWRPPFYGQNHCHCIFDIDML